MLCITLLDTVYVESHRVGIAGIKCHRKVIPGVSIRKPVDLNSILTRGLKLIEPENIGTITFIINQSKLPTLIPISVLKERSILIYYIGKLEPPLQCHCSRRKPRTICHCNQGYC